jgi:thiol-disulfide isomerase/thioredoxin
MNLFLEIMKPDELARWQDSYIRTKLNDEHAKRLEGYNRVLRVLFYCGSWCFDCARAGPILKRLVEAAGPKVEMRLIDREASDELKDELRLLGATRVPVAVFLTEDFWEVARVGDRTLSVYRSKMAREIGRGVDQGILSPQAKQRELEEWLDVVERALIMVRIAPLLRKRYGD